MGEGPCLDVPLEAGGEALTVSSVRVGVPHTIVFVDDIERAPVERLGPLIEHAPLFPQRTNADFVQVLDGRTVALRTWERGCGRRWRAARARAARRSSAR